MPEVLRSLGQDPAVVLGEIGIDPRLFDDPDNLVCLLYTSDAADERTSVDLGGRRIL